MHKSLHMDRKNHMKCIFAVILIFLWPSDHMVDQMSVSRANWDIYPVLYLICKLLIIDSYNPTKVQPYINKLE